MTNYTSAFTITKKDWDELLTLAKFSGMDVDNRNFFHTKITKKHKKLQKSKIPIFRKPRYSEDKSRKTEALRLLNLVDKDYKNRLGLQGSSSSSSSSSSASLVTLSALAKGHPPSRAINPNLLAMQNYQQNKATQAAKKRCEELEKKAKQQGIKGYKYNCESNFNVVDWSRKNFGRTHGRASIYLPKSNLRRCPYGKSRYQNSSRSVNFIPIRKVSGSGGGSGSGRKGASNTSTRSRGRIRYDCKRNTSSRRKT